MPLNNNVFVGKGSSTLHAPTFTFRLHVVFGHVVSGADYVTEMENQKVDANHRPYADVRISNCGELVLMKGTHDYIKHIQCHVYYTVSVCM